jgi:hypothetical protein
MSELLSQKRPRADTQSDLPQPRKARVDENYEIEDFTLFDEGSVSDMDWSLFDGQLSELTDSDLEEFSDGQLSELTDSDLEELSDGQLSELSELTDSDLEEFSLTDGEGLESEMELDKGLQDVAPISPLGRWEGVRKAKNGYKLVADLNENLKGPNIEDLDLPAVNLVDVEKKVMKKFIREYLVRNWPSVQLNPDLALSRNLAFSDAAAFWSALFLPQFKNFIDFLKNVPEGNRSPRVRCSKILIV